MIQQLISRVRRNHGLEHASIHVLSEQHTQFSAQGNANHRGFYLNIFGDVAESDVKRAVEEAFARMKGGEHQLAVHPNCGTVLLTTATMATLATQVAFGIEQRRQRSDKTDLAVLIGAMPSAILAASLALIASRPVGLRIQERYTTSGNLGKMELVSVKRIRPSATTRFFQMLLGQADNNAKAYFIKTAN